MQIFKRNGLSNKPENTNGMLITKKEKNLNIHYKLKTLQECEACLKMKIPWERINNSKKCKLTIKTLLIKRKQEKTHGQMINKTKMHLKSQELTWVISWLKTRKQQLHNLPLIDLSHITSRVLGKNKLMTFLPKEKLRSLPTMFRDKMKTQRSISGPYRI